MKKKMYIHIGFGKTGTTAIQSLFSRNRAELLKHDFLYPTTGLQIGGHHLLSPLGACDISGNTKLMYKQLAKEINDSPATNNFISSENFIFATPNLIEGVRKEFEKFDVKIIFYIRYQYALIESVFLQWQKVGDDYQGSVVNFFNKHKGAFDFEQRIAPWATYFGKDAIISRLYEKKLIGGDVCNDIAAVLGLEKLKVTSSGVDENFSLRPEFSALVSLVDSANVGKEERSKIIKELLRITERFYSVKKEHLIKADLKDEIAKFYEKSNIEFANKYLEPVHADYLCNILER
jgi:hypothetical protein